MEILVNKDKLWDLKLKKYIEEEIENNNLTVKFNLNRLIDDFINKEQPIVKIQIGGIL